MDTLDLYHYFVSQLNEKLGVMDQQLLKAANRKQQNTDNVLLLIENCDIKLEIVNTSTHLNQLETQIQCNCDVRVIFL